MADTEATTTLLERTLDATDCTYMAWGEDNDGDECFDVRFENGWELWLAGYGDDPVNVSWAVGDSRTGETFVRGTGVEDLRQYLDDTACEPSILPEPQEYEGTIEGFGKTVHLVWLSDYVDAGDGPVEIWGEGEPPARFDEQHYRIYHRATLIGAFSITTSQTEVIREGGEADARADLTPGSFFVRLIEDSDGTVDEREEGAAEELGIEVPDEDDEA